MKTFLDVTREDIAGILNTALDNGNWHTPHARDIDIVEQSKVVVYGKFLCSLHSTFHDQERWFNINHDTVQIWKNEPIEDSTLQRHLYITVHNLIKVAEWLSKFEVII